MKKRLLSLILSAVALFSLLCPMVHADDSQDFSSCTHNWVKPAVHGYSISIPNSDVSFGVEFEQCSKCHWYKHEASIFIVNATYYSPLAPDLNGLVPKELITYWCNKYFEVFGKNATPSKFTPGGGSGGSSGVSRKDLGYADDNGTPSVSSNGELTFSVYPKLSKSSSYSTFADYPTHKYIAVFLGCSRSAVTKEIQKGLVDHLDGHDWIITKQYDAYAAQRAADYQKTAHSKGLKLGNNYAYAAALSECILMGYKAVHRMKKHLAKLLPRWCA